MPAELTPLLSKLIAASDQAESVDVVLELRTPASVRQAGRSASMDAARQAFRRLADPVRSAIVDSGGTVHGEAWINGTVSCRVPVRALSALRARSDVVRIDVPARLMRDRSASR